MNKEIMKGDWNILKGKLKEKYAHLTDNDLKFEEGAEEIFYGNLQKKLGKSKEELDKELKEFMKHN